MTNHLSRQTSPADASVADILSARARLDDWLDQALEDTFPASDPVATPPFRRPAGTPTARPPAEDEFRAERPH
ncbi:MAG: hypothetical protein DIU54_007425 [Acidobacteriota bacterium]|jgi:hypothetical protein|nr:MAG: hypothetical protein DIU54_08825 [Acidobacteriota bacterium]